MPCYRPESAVARICDVNQARWWLGPRAALRSNKDVEMTAGEQRSIKPWSSDVMKQLGDDVELCKG